MHEGKLVRLRAYRREDIPQILAYFNDPVVKRTLHPGIPVPMGLEGEQRWYDENGKDPQKAFSFAIERRADGEYLGGCGYHQVDWKNSHCQVGIFLGARWHGQGLGTDALRTLVSFIFSQFSLNKIGLRVFSNNPQAVRCYEKCGFRKEGVLRAEIFRDGAFLDDIAMGILRTEWAQASKAW